MKSKKAPDEGAKRHDPQNKDPLTGEPGSHPVGTGVGAALGGAAAGAAVGAFAGPIGTVAGAVAGGVAGAAAGKSIAENVNPTAEEAYWREKYKTLPYYRPDHGFDYYLPAFRFGWESYEADRSWNDREFELMKKWDESRWEGEGGAPKLSWDEARLAARDAYQRVADSNAETTKMKPR